MKFVELLDFAKSNNIYKRFLYLVSFTSYCFLPTAYATDSTVLASSAISNVSNSISVCTTHAYYFLINPNFVVNNNPNFTFAPRSGSSSNLCSGTYWVHMHIVLWANQGGGAGGCGGYNCYISWDPLTDAFGNTVIPSYSFSNIREYNVEPKVIDLYSQNSSNWYDTKLTDASGTPNYLNEINIDTQGNTYYLRDTNNLTRQYLHQDYLEFIWRG